jgi:hypothetical protein
MQMDYYILLVMAYWMVMAYWIHDFLGRFWGMSFPEEIELYKCRMASDIWFGFNICIISYKDRKLNFRTAHS